MKDERLVPFIGGLILGGVGGSMANPKLNMPQYPTYYYPYPPQYYYPLNNGYPYPNNNYSNQNINPNMSNNQNYVRKNEIDYSFVPPFIL